MLHIFHHNKKKIRKSPQGVYNLVGATGNDTNYYQL